MMIPQQNSSPICPKWEDFPDIELYMDQVISVLERHLAPFAEEEKAITSTMINNYVKQKILPPPTNKRYCRDHLAILFILCVFKRFMQLSEISLLLENLGQSRSTRELYEFFCEEQNHALAFSQTKSDTERVALTDRAEMALRAACMAFAFIVRSREIFLSARSAWEEEAEKAARREARKKEEMKKKGEKKKEESKKKPEEKKK